MPITLIDLIKRGMGSGSNPNLYIKSDGAGKWVLSGASGTLAYSALIGDGTTNPWTVTHNLATTEIVVVIKIVSTGEIIEATVTVVDANSISINFAFENIPTTNQYKVTVLAGGSSGTLSTLIIPRCLVYNSVSQNLLHNTVTYLTANNEYYDVDNMHDNVTNNDRITINTAGVYLLTGNAAFAANATGYRQLRFEVNGGTIPTLQTFVNNGGVPTQCAMTGVWQFIVGDYVKLGMYQNSGGTLTVTSSPDYSLRFGATLIAR